MGERRREVKTYAVDMICPHCGTGIMRCDNAMVVPAYRATYRHVCPNCSYEATYFQVYPRIEYEEVERNVWSDEGQVQPKHQVQPGNQENR